MKEIVMNMPSLELIEGLLNEWTDHAQIVATNETLKKFNAETIDELQTIDSQMEIFDCGWIVWSFDDEELDSHVKSLQKKSGYYPSGNFRLNELPVQSTIMNDYYSNFIEEHLKEMGIPVRKRIHLD